MVQANETCEDNMSHAVYGDRHYYGVFDGHAGNSLSLFLAQTLVPHIEATIQRALEKVEVKSEERDKLIQLAIKHAFLSIDHDIVQDPINMVNAEIQAAANKRQTDSENAIERTEEEVQGKIGKPCTTLGLNRPTELGEAYELAMMGSCALLVILEPSLNRMHVACTGDSRAIQGTWDETSKLWKVLQLTEDQTSENPKEAAKSVQVHINLVMGGDT
jgi:pyruvate dehydrogenase phosphatase